MGLLFDDDTIGGKLRLAASRMLAWYQLKQAAKSRAFRKVSELSSSGPIKLLLGVATLRPRDGGSQSSPARNLAGTSKGKVYEHAATSAPQ